MNRFALVVSDVDGTLVTGEKVLTRRAIEAVHRLGEAGIGFSICSSRPPFGLSMVTRPLALGLPFGAFNGAAIAAPDLDLLSANRLSRQAARRAVELLEDEGVEVWLFTARAWFLRNPLGDRVAHEIRTIATGPTEVHSFEEHLDDASKIVGASSDLEKVARCEELGRAALGALATVARSQPYYVDFTPPGTHKGLLIAFLSQRLGISPQQIAVLGDMENDLEMFKRAGFSIAMGNAAPEVKAAAGATTLSNEEDGFALAIEREILGMDRHGGGHT